MKSQCFACTWKNELKSNDSGEKNLWNFPYLLYPDYNQMKQKLEEWYRDYNYKSSFWNTYNEDGYTFSQWNIYYLSKKYHCYREIQHVIFTLFNVLSTFPFFNELLLMGTKEDSKHHTAHHYLYNMEFGINGKQKKMFYQLKEWIGNFFFQRDDKGYHVYDYYKKLRMPYDLQKECQRLTESYKKQETKLFSNLYFLKKCTECGVYLQPYTDLIEYHSLFYDFLDKNEEWSECIEDFVTKREKCNDIYRNYLNDTNDTNDNDSIERHDYVIETYRKLFIW